MGLTALARSDRAGSDQAVAVDCWRKDQILTAKSDQRLDFDEMGIEN